MARITLAEFETLVLARLEGNNLMFLPDEIRRAINSGFQCANLVVAWNQLTRPLRSGATIANRHIYNVPSEIIFPQKVVFEGQALEKVSLTALSSTWPVFLQDTTATTGKQVSRWCPVGINKFILHPADSVGGGYVEVTGIGEPTEMVNDSDTVSIPKEGVTAIADYAAHIVQCKLQGTPFIQSIGMFKNYQSLLGLNKYWETFKQPNLFLDEMVQK